MSPGRLLAYRRGLHERGRKSLISICRLAHDGMLPGQYSCICRFAMNRTSPWGASEMRSGR